MRKILKIGLVVLAAAMAVVATFLPSSNVSPLDWRILRSPCPALMSSASMCMPRTRFSAFDAVVARSTSGLVRTKFDGETALAICFT